VRKSRVSLEGKVVWLFSKLRISLGSDLGKGELLVRGRRLGVLVHEFILGHVFRIRRIYTVGTRAGLEHQKFK
jgi:hypothetical protein